MCIPILYESSTGMYVLSIGTIKGIEKELCFSDTTMARELY